MKNVQDLIVAGRRVWHSAHDYTATCKEVVYRSEYSEMPWISVHGFMGLASPLSYFLPILTAAEVRGLPVGAVLVDTLTGEECEPYNGVELIYPDGDYMDIWNEKYRDIDNRFALKSYSEADDPRSSEDTLPTEEA